MRGLVDAGFFDDKFGLDDLAKMLEKVAIAATVIFVAGTLLVVPGGQGAAVLQLFLWAANAAELAAVSVNVLDGEIGAAVVGGAFIFAEGLVAATRIGRRLIAATESSRSILRSVPTNAASASAVRFIDVDLGLIPDDFAVDTARAIDLRSSEVVADRGTDLALANFATRTQRATSLLGPGDDVLDVIPVLARIDDDLARQLPVGELPQYREARDYITTPERSLF